MIRIDGNSKVYLGNNEIATIKKGNTVIWQKSAPAGIDYFYIENTYPGNNTLTLTTVVSGSPSSSNYSNTVQYSKDKENWTTVNFSTSTPTTIPMSQGEKVYFRNDSGKFNYRDTTSGTTIWYETSFTSNLANRPGGNLNSLLDYTNMDGVTLPTGAFSSLFLNNTGMSDASRIVIPQTVLGHMSHSYLFQGCSSLTTCPDFSKVTTLDRASLSGAFQDCTSLRVGPSFASVTDTGIRSGFSWTFHGCTSLETPPDMSGLRRVGYYGVNRCFEGCTSLTTTPDFSGVTSVDHSGFESAFQNCSSLQTAILPQATTFTETHCYYRMFRYCGNLTTVSQTLPATTLTANCYQQMFQGCGKLTTAPTLPAKTLTSDCYREMFSGCTKLNSVTVYADDISASNSHLDWMYNVASSGTFYNLGSATWPTNSASGIPTGWTQVTN